MWVILQNNADWDCFKSPILREILRIQNPLLKEHCSFLEVTHLFQQVGCVRNKLQFHTVEQNPKYAGLRLDGTPRSLFVGSDCFSPWKQESEP